MERYRLLGIEHDGRESASARVVSREPNKWGVFPLHTFNSGDEVVLAADAQETIAALQAQLEQVQEERSKYIQAVGLATTCAADMQIDTSQPIEMMQEVCKRFTQRTAELEALQRERDEAIEAASLPTWVCDGCGRVSSEGWINRVTESLDGPDYEMECPVCGVRAIEEDCASDLVRERDDLQAALLKHRQGME